MKQLFLRFTPLILIAASVLFFILGFREIHMQRVYSETTAIITAIITEDTTSSDDTPDHSVIVSYTVDGQNYQEELGTYTSSMREDDVIDILYNPENPRQITKQGAGSSVMMLGMAVLALFAAGASFVKKLRR